MLNQKLKAIITEQGITQTKLSEMTGIPKSGISQYLSGKYKPRQKALKLLACALNVPEAYLIDEPEKTISASNSKPCSLSVEQAAELMNKGRQFVRVGLQTGVLPFGYAVKMPGGRYTYYISPLKFTEYTGIKV